MSHKMPPADWRVSNYGYVSNDGNELLQPTVSEKAAEQILEDLIAIDV